MQIEIRQRGLVLDPELRRTLVSCLHQSLGRFAGYIREVWVYLREAATVRGGANTRIRLVVQLASGERVVVSGNGADLESIIPRTVHRARFAVRRQVKRRLASRRPPRRPVGHDFVLATSPPAWNHLYL
jgi:hypothetical protein